MRSTAAFSRGLVLTTLAGCLVILAPARAQLSAGFTAASFQFNLSNPGARSLGMGGAFAGLADDATAAYANPAGLTILTRPEVSFEGRTASFRLPLLTTEPIFGFVVRRRDGLDIGRVVAGATRPVPLGTPDAVDTTASFLSFVLPLREWTLAFYRHQLTDLEASGGEPIGPITEPVVFGDNTGLNVTSRGFSQGHARSSITGWGLAVARRFGDKFSLGLTLVGNQADIEVSRTSNQTQTCEGSTFCDSFERPNAYHDVVRSDDSDLTLNIGLMVRPGPRSAIGLVYRQGARLRTSEIQSESRNESNTVQTPEQSFPGTFPVPDVLSLGASYRATERLLASVEWSRVGYADLYRPTELPRPLFVNVERPFPVSIMGDFEVDDADELRAGLEFSFWQLKSIPAIRLGVWYDPDHQIRFSASRFCPPEGVRSADGTKRCLLHVEDRINGVADDDQRYRRGVLAAVVGATVGAALEDLFPPGEDRLHITGGFGVVLGSRYQIDAAFDYVDSDQYTISLSGVIRLDRRGRRAAREPSPTSLEIPSPRPAATPPEEPPRPEPPIPGPEIPAPAPEEASPPAPAAEEVQELPTPEPPPIEAARPSVESEIEQWLGNWSEAWSEQRVEDFLALHAPDFRPDAETSHEDWRRDRERKILEKEHIEVRIENLTITLLRDGAARAEFEQTYLSDTYCDRVRKTLVLEYQEGGWKIVESDIQLMERIDCPRVSRGKSVPPQAGRQDLRQGLGHGIQLTKHVP